MGAAASVAGPGHGSLPAGGRAGFPVSSLGGLPLLLALPFMYFPKVLEGDTQPWVLLAALVAFCTFRVKRFLVAADGPLIALALACVPVFALRSELGPDLLRAAYTYVSFVIFWAVCRRDNGAFFSAAVKITVSVWFAVGLYQYVCISLGLPVEIAGRFVEGRSGVPSITAEPSAYGSLSLLHIMYLLGEKKARNTPFIVAAALSVVLSGSLLAFALMVFPLFKLPARGRLPVLLGILALILGDYAFSASGVTSRVLGLNQGVAGLAALLLDPSLNLRVGQLYYTLYVHLADSLMLAGDISFMRDYNSFAATTSVFIDNGSNFVLPALGDIIYGTGIFGLGLIVLFFHAALAVCRSRGAKLQKLLFMLACMVNPISISNFFLVLYAQKEE